MWPTWADIVQLSERERGNQCWNFGMCGVSNSGIATNINIADSVFNFTETDRIMIVWTSLHRIDRLETYWDERLGRNVEVGDDAAIAMALIENIQRKDLNPVEEAVALKRLQQEFQLSQQQVADRVGKSRSSIANAMRLLTLEPDVLTMVEQGLIDTGHGKVLLALEGRQQLKAARQVSQSSLSVRQTERLVKSLLRPDGGARMTGDRVDPDVQRLERELSEKLGARVTLKTQRPGGGKLVITFSTNEELEGILTRFR